MKYKAILLLLVLSACGQLRTDLWLKLRDVKTGMPVKKYWCPQMDGAVWQGDTIVETHVFKESEWLVVESIDTVKY